jgi:hypothetical protein
MLAGDCHCGACVELLPFDNSCLLRGESRQQEFSSLLGSFELDVTETQCKQTLTKRAKTSSSFGTQAAFCIKHVRDVWSTVARQSNPDDLHLLMIH